MKKKTKRVACKHKSTRKKTTRRRVQRGGVRITTHMPVAGIIIDRPGDYEGDMNADNQPNGRGVMRYDNGHVYQGEWVNGKPHGHGTMTYSKGTYRGNWQDGMRDGVGTFVQGDGNVTKGHWTQNTIDNGQILYMNGDVYNGHLRFGLRHGVGTLTRRDGTSVYGVWEDDILRRTYVVNEGVASRTRYSGVQPPEYSIYPASTRPDVFGTTTRVPEAVITLSTGRSYNIIQARILSTSLGVQLANRETLRDEYNTPLNQTDLNKIRDFISFSVGGGKKRRIVR
jgi:hypothetical protein